MPTRPHTPVPSGCLFTGSRNGSTRPLQRTPLANYLPPPHRALIEALIEAPRVCKKLAARHHFSSTESPVRAPFPEATAAPRPIQARVSLPNPSHGQPPSTSNCPCIRREQRGSPVQLAQGGWSPQRPSPPPSRKTLRLAHRRSDGTRRGSIRVFGRVQAPVSICGTHPPRSRRPFPRNCKPAIKTNDTSPRP